MACSLRPKLRYSQVLALAASIGARRCQGLHRRAGALLGCGLTPPVQKVVARSPCWPIRAGGAAPYRAEEATGGAVGHYDHEQWARAQLREEQRHLRAEAAAEKAAERERKAQETAAGRAKAEQLNADLEHRVDRLQHILLRGLDRPARVDTSELLRHDEPPELDLGEHAAPLPRPDWADFVPPEPGVLAGLFGARGRHERRLAAARDEYERACRHYDTTEAARQQWARSETARHDGLVHAHRAELEPHNTEVQALAAGIESRDRESAQAYLEIALSRTPIPDELPRQVEVAYTPRGEQAVVRVELPPLDVTPGGRCRRPGWLPCLFRPVEPDPTQRRAPGVPGKTANRSSRHADPEDQQARSKITDLLHESPGLRLVLLVLGGPMLATLLFVHGTGVRAKNYAATLKTIQAQAAARGLPLEVRGCFWGDAEGARLHAGGASIPGYDEAGGKVLARSTS